MLLGVSGIVWTLIEWIAPEHHFAWFLFIPVFFYLFGWFYIFMFDYCRRYASRRLLSVYMGTKVVKMLFSMIIVFFYICYVRLQEQEFILVFFLFYLCTMLYETVFFVQFEKNLIKKLKDKRNNE